MIMALFRTESVVPGTSMYSLYYWKAHDVQTHLFGVRGRMSQAPSFLGHGEDAYTQVGLEGEDGTKVSSMGHIFLWLGYSS